MKRNNHMLLVYLGIVAVVVLVFVSAIAAVEVEAQLEASYLEKPIPFLKQVLRTV